MHDTINWWPQVTVRKYEANTLRELVHDLGLPEDPSGADLRWAEEVHGATPTKILEAEGNSLTNVGRTRVADLIIGNGAPKKLDATSGGTGVGDSSTANSSPNTATALLAATNKLYAPLDAAPADANPGVITAQTTYQLSDANFAWNEWGLTIASGTPAKSSTFATAVGSGILLNRAVQSLGTKVSTAVWVLQVQLTLS